MTGVLAVEMFETPTAGVLVNELAMRPHNSGHWTIEGAGTSQFEQHLRAVLDLPLGDPDDGPAGRVMANVLGGDFRRPLRRLPARASRTTRAAGPHVRQAGTPRAQGGSRHGLGNDLTTCESVPGTPPPSCGARDDPIAMSEARATRPLVGIVMGSDCDWEVMQAAAEALAEFDVPHEADVVSAHRMPRGHDRVRRAGAPAAACEVIIAGAGGAAHLPGMLAAVTPLPVIGVPVPLAPPRRAGLAAVDRADARRCAGRDGRHRRRPQRRAARGPHPGRVRRPAALGDDAVPGRAQGCGTSAGRGGSGLVTPGPVMEPVVPACRPAGAGSAPGRASAG